MKLHATPSHQDWKKTGFSLINPESSTLPGETVSDSKVNEQIPSSSHFDVKSRPGLSQRRHWGNSTWTWLFLDDGRARNRAATSETDWICTNGSSTTIVIISTCDIVFITSLAIFAPLNSKTFIFYLDQRFFGKLTLLFTISARIPEINKRYCCCVDK